MPNREHSKPLTMAMAAGAARNDPEVPACTLCRQEKCRAAVVKTILEPVPHETLRKLWARTLSQSCPSCGHVEPAGLRCSRCFGAVLPERWSPDTRKRRSAPENRQTTRPGRELEAA